MRLSARGAHSSVSMRRTYIHSKYYKTQHTYFDIDNHVLWEVTALINEHTLGGYAHQWTRAGETPRVSSPSALRLVRSESGLLAYIRLF